jgi:ketosteroid isomerase-like protein
VADDLELAEALMSAIQRGDVEAVRQLYSPDAVIWHNFDGVEQKAEENLVTLQWVTTNIASLRYEEIQRYPIPNGFVETHVLRGTAPNGTELDVPACLIGFCEDGRITRLEEYLDTAQVAALRG